MTNPDKPRALNQKYVITKPEIQLKARQFSRKDHRNGNKND